MTGLCVADVNYTLCLAEPFQELKKSLKSGLFVLDPVAVRSSSSALLLRFEYKTPLKYYQEKITLLKNNIITVQLHYAELVEKCLYAMW